MVNRQTGFNGAALFQVRKVLHRRRNISVTLRFNGAALFQVRKEIYYIPEKEEYRMLQWGRTFSSAESKSFVSKELGVIELQWGRTS